MNELYGHEDFLTYAFVLEPAKKPLAPGHDRYTDH